MSLIYSTKRFLLTLLGILTLSSVFAEHEAGHKEEFNVSDFIMHHIQDAHEWHMMGPEHGEGAVSLSLPIILVDGGLQVFSSAVFYHGEAKSFTDAEGKTHHYLVAGDKGYAMYHEKIYKLSNGELQFHEGHPLNVKPMDFSITKNTASMLFGSLLILVLMLGTARYYRSKGAVAPRGVAKFMEPLIVFVRDDIAKANIHSPKFTKFVPYLLTIFFFIWINNMLGLIPILPGGANLTGSISVTIVLAIFTLLITVLSGNSHYWKHIFATPGVPKLLLIIMIPIEVVGIFTKPFALMIRLFANMTAGHVIIIALVSLIFINQSMGWGFLSVPMALFISVLEILVAFLQAYLFAMLSALFIGAAIEEHH